MTDNWPEDPALTITVRRWLPGDDTPDPAGMVHEVTNTDLEEAPVVAEERDTLVAKARELGVYDAPEERTDQELIDAIAAEEAAGAWLARMEALPTDEMKRDAVRRLAEDLRRANEDKS